MKVTKEQFIGVTYDELLAENAKLVVKLNAEHIVRQNAERDNDRLRELMADMLSYYAMPNDIDYRREADLLERAHEMGVDA